MSSCRTGAGTAVWGVNLRLRYMDRSQRAETQPELVMRVQCAAGGAMAAVDSGNGTADGVKRVTVTACDHDGHEKTVSTPSTDGVGMFGADGCGGGRTLRRVAAGISYLVATLGQDGRWEEKQFTGTGFPNAFYLRYHGYSQYFPLWALARYRNLKASKSRQVLLASDGKGAGLSSQLQIRDHSKIQKNASGGVHSEAVTPAKRPGRPPPRRQP